MGNRVGLHIGELRLRFVCNRGHSEHEVEYVTGRIDDDGRLLMFAHHFDWTQSEAVHFSGPDSVKEWQRFIAANPPADYLVARSPSRSAPQRVIKENESITWRFFCKSCRWDIPMPNSAVAALFRQAQIDGSLKTNINEF